MARSPRRSRLGEGALDKDMQTSDFGVDGALERVIIRLVVVVVVVVVFYETHSPSARPARPERRSRRRGQHLYRQSTEAGARPSSRMARLRCEEFYGIQVAGRIDQHTAVQLISHCAHSIRAAGDPALIGINIFERTSRTISVAFGA
jgi:hypothetical protein